MPKKSNSTRKNTKYRKKSVKHHKKKNHKKSIKIKKQKLAGVRSQVRLNTPELNELRLQVRDYPNAFIPGERSIHLQDFEELQNVRNNVRNPTQTAEIQIRAQIHERMELGKFIQEIQASLPPSIANFPGIDEILQDEEENLSHQAQKQRKRRILLFISKIRKEIEKTSGKIVREKLRKDGLLDVPQIMKALQTYKLLDVLGLDDIWINSSPENSGSE